MNVGILLAAGQSRRFGSDKLCAEVYGETVIERALRYLHDAPKIDVVVVVVNTKNKKMVQNLVRNFAKVKKVTLGGKTRFASVKNGVRAGVEFLQRSSKEKNRYFIIHNAANPFATENEMDRAIAYLNNHKKISGVAVGHEIFSTLKKVNEHGDVKNTVPRGGMWAMETPQVVRTNDFLNAMTKVRARPTDDLEVLEVAGFSTAVIPASAYNKKITLAADLPITRVGFGEDSHKFDSTKSTLVLGGVQIKNVPKLMADSDGDVILHALCNAIASAIGDFSLGTYASAMCRRGMKDSKKYVEKILTQMRKKKFNIVNCAIALECARPKIDPISSKIKKSIAHQLKITLDRVGITATSGEKMTPFGLGKGIKCSSTVLLERR